MVQQQDHSTREPRRRETRVGRFGALTTHCHERQQSQHAPGSSTARYTEVPTATIQTRLNEVFFVSFPILLAYLQAAAVHILHDKR